MPRVLRIINRLNMGGPTFNAAYLTKFMEPEFETLLVSGMRDESEGSAEFIVEAMGIKPIYIPEMYRELNPFRDRKAYTEIRKLIREFKPDVVHTHAAKPGAVGRLAAYHEKVPVIVHTFHGHVFHSYFGKIKTQVFINIERYLSSISTQIIAISPQQKHELTEIYKVAKPEKTCIVPLGFDLRRFAENREEKRRLFREKYGLTDNDIAIGIVGRLVPVKNHSLFLKAVANVVAKTKKSIKVFIIGDGELRGDIEEEARILGLLRDRPIVVFTSWIKEIDVSNAGLDIIALTSDNEGTPVSLIEAQASAKPIVSTRVGGISDIMEEGEAGLLSPKGDIQAFATNLLKMVEDDSMRSKMAGRGEEFVFRKYSYQRLCSDMAALYNGLLNKK